MEAYIFLTIYILVSSLTISNGFHLKRVKRIIENIPEDVHNLSAESFENKSDIFSANKLHENNLSGPFDVHLNENSTQSSLEKMGNQTSNTSHIGKPISNNTESKTCERHIWTSNRYKLPEKLANIKNAVSHPKRESHPIWHKNFKDWQKLGAASNAQENNVNRFDVVVVDIQPIYAKLREKQQLYTHNPPAVHYVPMNPSSSILDIFFGMNPYSTDFLTEPVAVENDFFFQDRSLSSPWNRRSSFGGMVKPDIFQMEEWNGYKDRKDVNVAQLVGQIPEAKNCTCGGRN